MDTNQEWLRRAGLGLKVFVKIREIRGLKSFVMKTFSPRIAQMDTKERDRTTPDYEPHRRRQAKA